jgi:hypothetical protein
MDDPSKAPRQESISRSDLHKRLVIAAVVRSLLTMLSSFATFFLVAAISLILDIPQNVAQVIFVVVFISFPLVICWIVSVQICRRMVRCPCCAKSLWSCGNGAFKPRRMRLKDDAFACPHCGVPIV